MTWTTIKFARNWYLIQVQKLNKYLKVLLRLNKYHQLQYSYFTFKKEEVHSAHAPFSL
jgi:hypothetical protein